MGIKNLNVLIKNFKKKENLSKYSGKKFGIDLNLYLYKFLCFNSNNYLSSFFNQITLLLNNNITPVYAEPTWIEVNTAYYTTGVFSELKAIPEPTTLSLLSIGAISLLRKRKP